MKKRILQVFAITAGTLLLASTSHATGHVEEVQGDPTKEPVKIRATLYTDQGTTFSGQEVREGIIAGKKEWQGMAALIWTVEKDANGNDTLGEFLGYYEVLDTGAGIDTDGDGVGDTIPSGQSIDIYRETQAEVEAWQKENGDYLYIYLVDGKG